MSGEHKATGLIITGNIMGHAVFAQIDAYQWFLLKGGFMVSGNAQEEIPILQTGQRFVEKSGVFQTFSA